MTLVATSSQSSLVASRSFLLRPGVSNECLPIGHLPNVVELSTRRLGAQNSPRTRADLTAHRRGSHAHAPPQVVGHDCEPALTLAVTLDRKGAGGLRREVKGRQHRIPMQPAQSAHIYAYEPRSSCADLPLRLRLLGVFQCSIHGRTGDPGAVATWGGSQELSLIHI